MFDHISDDTARSCLECLVQLHREGDTKTILSIVGGLDDAAGNPMGEMLLQGIVEIGKAPVHK